MTLIRRALPRVVRSPIPLCHPDIGFRERRGDAGLVQGNVSAIEHHTDVLPGSDAPQRSRSVLLSPRRWTRILHVYGLAPPSSGRGEEGRPSHTAHVSSLPPAHIGRPFLSASDTDGTGAAQVSVLQMPMGAAILIGLYGICFYRILLMEWRSLLFYYISFFISLLSG